MFRPQLGPRLFVITGKANEFELILSRWLWERGEKGGAVRRTVLVRNRIRTRRTERLPLGLLAVYH